MSAFSCHAKKNKLFDTALCLLLYLTGKKTFAILAVSGLVSKKERLNRRNLMFKKLFLEGSQTESAEKKLAKSWRRVKKINSKIKISFLNSLSFNSSVRL